MKHMNMSVPGDCDIRYGALALAIALKAHPGKVTDEELEREAGGTGLRYSFDIKAEAPRRRLA
jgi:uncharacterized membrane protein YkoI